MESGVHSRLLTRRPGGTARVSGPQIDGAWIYEPQIDGVWIYEPQIDGVWIYEPEN